MQVRKFDQAFQDNTCKVQYITRAQKAPTKREVQGRKIIFATPDRRITDLFLKRRDI